MESIENPLPNSSINFVPGSVKSSSFHITIHGKPEIVLWIFFCYSTAEIHRQRASLPPDGTTFLHLSLGELQKKTIPSYSYWNFQVSIMLFLRYFLRYNWSNFGQLWTSRYRSTYFYFSSTKKSLPMWKWISFFLEVLPWVCMPGKTPFQLWHSTISVTYSMDTERILAIRDRLWVYDF